MTSTSALLNQSLRQRVAPVLRTAGFQTVDARNGWSWRDELVWVFNVRAVGSYFSSVTGWPPGSVGVWLGVYYAFTPETASLKRDAQGRPKPAEHSCQMRSDLECGLDQTRRLAQLANPAEQARRDLWWVESDGSNADEVAGDIAISLFEKGLPWFTRSSDLNQALAKMERGRDCFTKFDLAALLARAVRDEQRWSKYALLAEAEALRLQRPIDRRARYGI